MTKKKAGFSTRSKRIIAVIVMAALLVAAVVIFINRKRLADALSASGTGLEAGEPWGFENGAKQVFAPCGASLAIASSTGFQLLDSNGITLTRQVFSLGVPALSAAGDRVAVWDVGGRELRLADAKGNVTELETEKPLISVSLSSSGFLAVSSEETGYKGLVTVYDKELAPVFRWHSGAGYLLSADVSPDGKSMAAVTASEAGGKVHFFSLGSEEEKGAYTAPDTVIVDICWLSGDKLCAITETGAVFLKTDGSEAASYDFGGLHLTAYSLGGDGYVTLALSKYLSGGTDAIVAVSENGEERGRAVPEGEVKYLASLGRHTAVLYSGGAAVYSQDMKKEGETTGLRGVRAVIVRPRGDAVLIGAYAGEVWKF